MDVLTFSMSGTPRAKGRPRTTVRGGFATVYTDAKTKKYEASVADLSRKAMREKPPISGAISVSLRFRMPIPKSETKPVKAAMAAGEVPHTSKPDIDNLQKAILDGMNGIVFVDDSQIVRSFTTKVYSETPGVDVRVEALEPQS